MGVQRSGVGCSVPAGLPAGRYKVVAVHPGAGMAAPDNPTASPVYYTASPRVASLANNAGSTAGGGELVLRSPSPGGFNASHPAANAVWVGGRACEVLSHTMTANELRCRAPGVAGLALGEYWRLGSGTWTLPDLRGFTKPCECICLFGVRGSGWLSAALLLH